MKYRVNKLNENTWQICEGDGPSRVYMYFLLGKKSAALIDAGYGTIDLPEILKHDIGISEDIEIFMLLTHGHVDHIGATGFFDRVYMDLADKPVYSQHVMPVFRQIFLGEEKLKIEPKPVDEICDINSLFDSALDLGDRKIFMLRTPGHSVGSLCFYDENNRWLFTGDSCCKADLLLNMDYACDLSVYGQSVTDILKRDFELTWPGHHQCPVSREVVNQFKEAVELIEKGSLKGEKIDHPAAATIRYSYKDIAICEVDRSEE